MLQFMRCVIWVKNLSVCALRIFLACLCECLPSCATHLAYLYFDVKMPALYLHVSIKVTY